MLVSRDMPRRQRKQRERNVGKLTSPLFRVMKLSGLWALSTASLLWCGVLYSGMQANPSPDTLRTQLSVFPGMSRPWETGSYESNSKASYSYITESLA